MNQLKILDIFDKRSNHFRYLRQRAGPSVTRQKQFDALLSLDDQMLDPEKARKMKHGAETIDDNDERIIPLQLAQITKTKDRFKLEKIERKLDKRLNFNHIPIQDQIVVMFPGHGNQHVKMGEKVLEHHPSRRLFEQANEILQFDLLDLCLNGPKTKLDQTYYAQLAVFVSSLAAFEKMKSEQPDLMQKFTDCAGYSLGEMCALVASNVMNFTDALKLVKLMAETTERCCRTVPSGMMTIRTCAKSKLETALLEAREHSNSKGEPPICDIASYLFCHVKVVGGTLSSLKYFTEHADHFKIQIIKHLPVYGAFHTVLMNEAYEKANKFLSNVKINIPTINVYSNYTGKPHEFNQQRMKRDIARQVSNPIKWEQIAQLLFLKHQDYTFPSYFEVGPGTQLGTILYHVSKKTRSTYLNYPP